MRRTRKELEVLTAEETLKKYWGYDTFRPLQREIIESSLSGRDTLALMPTGGGKSITYQVPGLIMEGVCVVVSPIIALMKDQVDALRRRGVSAVAIHSGLSRKEIDRLLDNCIYGDVKFLYLSPERVETELFLLRLQRMRVSLVAVDEAHCISQWGYDFRPSYLNISKIREVIPNTPIIALSASATDVVARDIMAQLKFSQEHIIRTDFSRPNLSFVVRCDDNKELQIQSVLRTVEGSGIIYVRTRDLCLEMCEKLQRDGVSATYYHAGLPHGERALRQEEWLRGECRVMVATNAFGMGIDKGDVRFVIHHSMCDSLEAYYQEAGRAGRDGRRSYALLLVGSSDQRRIRRHIDIEFPPLEDIKRIYDSICNFLMIPYEHGAWKAYKFNIYDFCRQKSLFGATVRSALKLLEANEYLSYIEDSATPSRVIFRIDRDELYHTRITSELTEEVLNALLRMYSGLFSELRRIDENEIAAWCKTSFEGVVDALKELSRLRVIYYIGSSISPIIRLYTERAKPDEIYISPESYLHRREMCEDRVAKMLEYIENTDVCRSSRLVSYFGEREPQDCGVCDICLGHKQRRENSNEDIKTEILNMLKTQEYDIQQLAIPLKTSPSKLSAIVDELLAQGHICYNGAFLRVKS